MVKLQRYSPMVNNMGEAANPADLEILVEENILAAPDLTGASETPLDLAAPTKTRPSNGDLDLPETWG